MLNKIELTEEFKNSIFPSFPSVNLPDISLPDVTVPVDIDLRYPEDLTEVDGSGIGVLYGKFMGWAGYFKYLLNTVESKVLYLKSAIKNYAALTERELVDNGVPAKNIKSAVALDLDLLMLEQFLAELVYEAKLLEARFEYFDSCSKAISRELSRRIAEKEKTHPF